MCPKKKPESKCKCCGTCKHFSLVPGMQRTGICDENNLNKRSGVPVVLAAADEVCWQWEKDEY